MPSPRPVVVLLSGAGTLLQALLRACEDPAYGVRVAAVGADRPGAAGLQRARAAGLPTFLTPLSAYPDRASWDQELASRIEALTPPEQGERWVLTAGFMKILGPAVLSAARVLNSHPSLLPSFPGAHPVRDALASGVRVTGCTVHLVDAGVDTGPILAQRPVPVRPGDTEAVLHERIKVVERDLLVRTIHRVLTTDPAPTERTT